MGTAFRRGPWCGRRQSDRKSVLVGEDQVSLGRARLGVSCPAVRSPSHRPSLSLSFPVCIMSVGLALLRAGPGVSEARSERAGQSGVLLSGAFVLSLISYISHNVLVQRERGPSLPRSLHSRGMCYPSLKKINCQNLVGEGRNGTTRLLGS